MFAHEYAHDLGLPDLYDTSGNTGGAENSTGFWTLMSSGANIGDGGPNGIGDAPTDLGAWEKFQLGWLGCDTCPGGKFYDVARPARRPSTGVGANDGATKEAQALIVLLPEKRKDTTLVAPKTGSWIYWSTMGDDIDNDDDEAVHDPGRGHARRGRLVRHRGALRLRVPRGLDRTAARPGRRSRRTCRRRHPRTRAA